MSVYSIYVAAPQDAVRAAAKRITERRGIVLDVEAAPEYDGYEAAVDLYNHDESVVRSVASDLRIELPGVTVDTEFEVEAKLSATS